MRHGLFWTLIRQGSYGWAALLIGGSLVIFLISNAVTSHQQEDFFQVAEELTPVMPDDPETRADREALYQQMASSGAMSPQQKAALANQLGLSEEARRALEQDEGRGRGAGRAATWVPIPLGLLLGFFVLLWIAQKTGRPLFRLRPVERAMGVEDEPQPPPRPAATPPVTLDEVRATQEVRRADTEPKLLDIAREDALFSEPVLYRFLHSLHRAVHRATASGDWEPLRPYVVPGVRRHLEETVPGLAQVAQILAGPLQVKVVELSREWTRLEVGLWSSRLERGPEGSGRFVLEERWSLRRAGATTSLSMDVMERMGCPSCGATVDLDREGACGRCAKVVTWGQFAWQVTDVEVLSRRPAGSVTATWREPDPEHWTAATANDHRLGEAIAQLKALHPAFDPGRLLGRVALAFQAIQQAGWNAARPYASDLALDAIRYQADRLAATGLRWRRTSLRLHETTLARLVIDEWFATAVVRLKWEAVETWVDNTGQVAAGDPDQPVLRSQYWVFVRGHSAPEPTGDPDACASCGNALDRVSQEGVCGHCGADLASCEWDWMLLRRVEVGDYRA